MIYLAIIIFILLNLLPKWILKDKYTQLKNEFSWKIPLIKLTGLGFSLLLAFILTFGVTLSTQDKFIENKNAIYGLEFNQIMEELGFQDSMKILSINGAAIERVDDIFKTILIASGKTEVFVEKNGIQNKIEICENGRAKLLINPTSTPIVPIMNDSNRENKIIITSKNHKFSDVLDRYRVLWKQAVIIANPVKSEHSGIGGFITISKITNIQGYLIILSLNLIIIGILNLIPLPGFSIGNFTISIIETVRKRLFNKKRKRVIQWISILLTISALIINMI